MAAHGSHVFVDGSAHVPESVQSSTHLPLPPFQPLSYGVSAAHDAQSEASGPLHVVHDVWHAWHLSVEVALPPSHVKPTSIASQS